MHNPLLLTIDFEMTGYENNVSPEKFSIATRALLRWLKTLNIRLTFFCLGEVLEKFPDLIQEIRADGHEIASHGWHHKPLEKLTPDDLKRDLDRFLACANKLNLGTIRGYRAPFFSLTPKTIWAVDIIHQAGFTYDSSMLPARTILYGFSGGNTRPHTFANGLIEIPVTVWQPLSGIGFNAGIPVLGGTYLRLLPTCVTRHFIHSLEKTDGPLVGYFHPYDIDPTLDSINAFDNNPIYNALLNAGQKKMRQKISFLFENRNVHTIMSWIEENRRALQ